MAIARRPNGNRPPAPAAAQERAAEAFIQGAAKSAAAEPEPGGRKTPIMLRFDATLLRRVDSAAKRRGISRSAWIAFKVSEALDAEEA
jgi:predicted HicB family RNase H-like nuclease